MTNHTGGATGPILSRRAALGLGAGALAAGLTGCGEAGSGSGFGSNTTLNIPAHVPPPDVPEAIVSTLDGVPPAYLKLPYPRPRATQGVPGSGADFTTFQVNWGSPPRPQAQNEYWQEFNQRLGVKYQPNLVPADAYDTKLSTMLAGGKLPDLIFLHTNSANAQRAIQDGAFADLSEILGGEKIKQYPNLAAVQPFEWEVSAVNNGLYGVPTSLPYVNTMFAYRKDWATKLGYPEAPKNAEEFYELMTAMTKGKPSQRRATFGFGAYPGSVQTFLNTMFRIPNGWVSSGGQLTSMFETDEFEQALEFAAKLWKGGAFHPDALGLAEQGAKDRDLFYNGVTGWQAASGDNWYLAGMLGTIAQKDPGAQPEMMLPFGHDGKEYGFPRSSGVYAVVAIPAEVAAKSDRLDEVLRIFDYLRAPVASEEGFFLRYGVDGVHYTLDANNAPEATKNTAALTDRDAMFYTGLVPAAYYYPANPEDAQTVARYTEAVTKSAVANPVDGLFAPSDAKVSGKLGELVDDYTGGLVSGRLAFSDLAKFRAAWKAQGGDQLRDEFQTALQNKG